MHLTIIDRQLFKIFTRPRANKAQALSFGDGETDANIDGWEFVDAKEFPSLKAFQGVAMISDAHDGLKFEARLIAEQCQRMRTYHERKKSLYSTLETNYQKMVRENFASPVDRLINVNQPKAAAAIPPSYGESSQSYNQVPVRPESLSRPQG